MDGRLNFSIITNMPIGIIRPMRNLAGTFDLGYDSLGKTLIEWVNDTMRCGRDCLMFCTYHWSKGDKHRGCFGHNYDVEEARSDAFDLMSKLDRNFGNRSVVYPILVGIETDEDSLVLHGHRGRSLDVVENLDCDPSIRKEMIRQLYPDMSEGMLASLAHVVEGNVAHIKELRQTPRSLGDIVHSEDIMCVGRGFDSLHWLNRALIIGPYSYDLSKPIESAAKILWDNLQASNGKELSAREVLLMTTGIHEKDNIYQMRFAEEKALSLRRLAESVIKATYPELHSRLQILSGTVDIDSLLFKPLDGI